MLNLTLDIPVQDGPFILINCFIGHNLDNTNEVFVGVTYQYNNSEYTIYSENITVADAPNFTLEEFSNLLGIGLHLFQSEVNERLTNDAKNN